MTRTRPTYVPPLFLIRVKRVCFIIVFFFWKRETTGNVYMNTHTCSQIYTHNIKGSSRRSGCMLWVREDKWFPWKEAQAELQYAMEQEKKGEKSRATTFSLTHHIEKRPASSEGSTKSTMTTRPEGNYMKKKRMEQNRPPISLTHTFIGRAGRQCIQGVQQYPFPENICFVYVGRAAEPLLTNDARQVGRGTSEKNDFPSAK